MESPRVERLLIRTDGAARGNPGPASAGAVLIDASMPGAGDPDARPISVIARALGIRTNNVAEYAALVLALREAVSMGAREVDLHLDSQLIVQQLNGKWRVKDEKLKGLFEEARRHLAGFRRWSAIHEPRAHNRAADALANLALDDPAAAAAREREVRERWLRESTAPPRAVGEGTSPAPAPVRGEATPATAPAPSSRARSRRTAASAAIVRSRAAWICATCGVQYPLSDEPPADCPICEDERQYVPDGGQRWTTMADLVAVGHRNLVVDEEPDLVSIGTEPEFAIGQRALLVRTPAGNVLWDCISLLDEETVTSVRDLGGLAAIAISHPHFYGAMTAWSAAFGNCPVYIHASDREWVQYPGPGLEFWDGATLEILHAVTLVNTGGHFPGATVLHWAAGAEGRGALLTGDSITVVPDTRWVSFMYSYPNLIPLADADVRTILERVQPFRYDRIYSLRRGRVTASDGPGALERSAERYLAHR